MHPDEKQGGNVIKRGRNSITPSKDMEILKTGEKRKENDSLSDLDDRNLSE